MKKRKLFAFVLAFILSLAVICSQSTAYADGYEYYLGGFPIGFSIYTEGVDVLGFSQNVTTERGKLKIGDRILEINGRKINSAEDIEDSLKDYFVGDLIIVKYERDGEIFYTEIEPYSDDYGKYRLGLYVRNNISGIGTVTYVRSDNEYAGLGHAVINENGQTVKINGGDCFACNVSGVVRGKKGSPGELEGIFIKDKPLGNVLKNKSTGVYGFFSGKVMMGEKIQPNYTAKPGKAYIYTTVDGFVSKKYSISIVKCDYKNANNKNFVIKITDDDLIKETGGIVQGMSGSPIVQNGKLVGAVTHVFVNDPTRGFGIGIENMINE